MSTKLRPAPPPLEGSDRLVTGVITAAWAIALIVVAAARASLPAGDRWWLWTCLAGTVLGLFGLWYVPRLKRSRGRSARRRAAAATQRGEGSRRRPDRPAGSPADGSPADG